MYIYKILKYYVATKRAFKRVRFGATENIFKIYFKNHSIIKLSITPHPKYLLEQTHKEFLQMFLKLLQI